MRAKGLGANVVITEIDPVKAIEAVFDGFKVMPMLEAARYGDIFVTLTGCVDVIRQEHIKVMKNGAILANAGHFDVEINKDHLKELAVSCRRARRNIEEFLMEDGRKIYLLAEGRLVNLAAADGHPTEIMDLSFALQALSVMYVLHSHENLSAKVYNVPAEVDSRVAGLKLRAMDIAIDKLTPEQTAYLSKA